MTTRRSIATGGWRRFVRITHLALLAFGLAACSRTPATQTGAPAAACTALEPVFPAAEWERIATPECAGWSSDGLARVAARLATMPTTGFVVVQGGRIVMAYGDLEAVSYLASVRKSVLSMLYGIYVNRGVINLEETLAQLGIDDVGGLSDREKQATVRHLLSARSGIYHAASNPGDDLESAPPRGSQRPGEYFLYNNWDFNALGTIFEKKTGIGIYDALEAELARPLGFQDFDRSRHRLSGDTTRSIHRAYHMHLSTRDMARIGYLMLRQGVWAGRTIVPRDWVHESTSAITPVSEMNPRPRRNGPFGYGYLWWVFDGPNNDPVFEGAFTGLGAIGQQILVIPKLDVVVAHKTRPNRENRTVSHPEFLRVIDLLLEARCTAPCAAESLRPAA